MKNRKGPSDVIRISVTMERELKQKYARLAVELDLSFSQLVRYALRRVSEGFEDFNSLKKESGKPEEGRDMSS